MMYKLRLVNYLSDRVMSICWGFSNYVNYTLWFSLLHTLLDEFLIDAQKCLRCSKSPKKGI